MWMNSHQYLRQLRLSEIYLMEAATGKAVLSRYGLRFQVAVMSRIKAVYEPKTQADASSFLLYHDLGLR